jgi:hypothetical protein
LARLNSEYGSEFHLLRMLGRHRAWFDGRVLAVTGADHVEWLDFPSGEMRRNNSGNVLWDCEWQQMNFLPPDDAAKRDWNAAWPTRGTGHNWDAIARLRFGAAREWLLVEAKANMEELRSECGAEDKASVELIARTLNATKLALGVPEACDWTRPYYQLCNRLAALQFLNRAGSPARLLYIYFCGDAGDERRTCPKSEEAWRSELDKQNRHVGLATNHPLHDRIHKLFIDVECRT